MVNGTVIGQKLKMKLLGSIKSFFSKTRLQKVGTVIITDKQCPHCTSRGLFVFNVASKPSSKHDQQDEKNKKY